VTVRVGLVGTSWWADRMYFPALADHPDGRIVAVCGRDEARTAASAERWGVDSWFTDWRRMIDEGGLDAVIVASANDTHGPITHAAIDAGLHVLCEKPLALNATEADAMASRAAAAGLITMVAFTYRWMPTNRYVKRLLDEDAIGRPFLLDIAYLSDYARHHDYIWRLDVEHAGSGVLGDLGSHCFDLARWFLGEIDEVGAVTRDVFARPDSRPDGSPYRHADDTVTATVQFASGAVGTLRTSSVCWPGPGGGQTIQLAIHGTEGTITSLIDWQTVQEVRLSRPGEPGPAGLAEPTPVPDDLWPGRRYDSVADTYSAVFSTTDAMARGWVSGIAAGRPVQPDMAVGARIQRLLDAALESAASGGRAIGTHVRAQAPG
jgi:predicted dehydrogenase